MVQNTGLPVVGKDDKIDVSTTKWVCAAMNSTYGSNLNRLCTTTSYSSFLKLQGQQKAVKLSQEQGTGITVCHTCPHLSV